MDMSTTGAIGLIKKSISFPDETRTFPNGKVEVVHLGDHCAALVTLRPGWRWSRDVRPIAQTETCLTRHLQYVLSGRLMVQMEDNTLTELSPGDFAYIPSGHDAWVLGEESFVAVDLMGMSDYAGSAEESSYGSEPDEIVGFD